jgi:hypothetical protein
MDEYVRPMHKSTQIIPLTLQIRWQKYLQIMFSSSFKLHLPHITQFIPVTATAIPEAYSYTCKLRDQLAAVSKTGSAQLWFFPAA